nr:Cof-type HAD-IIB family hydrolase [Bacillus manliponensis]
MYSMMKGKELIDLKLIALDMDGTLLSSDLKISKENLEAIKDAQEAGHTIMICSGRAKEDALNLLGEFNLSLPIGSSNGAIVYADGQVINARYLKKEKVYEVAKKIESIGFPYKLYTNEGVYAPHNWKEQVMKSYQLNKHTLDVSVDEFERITAKQERSNLITYFKDIEEMMTNTDLHVSKFFILTFHKEQRKQLLQLLQQDTEVMVTASASTNLEVMDQYGHKENGLREMAHYFNIPMENTVAIGDNFNDVPMLKAAGLSIAMGNAEEEVKQLCNVVTTTNDEHGVAHAIYQYVLQETKQK